MKRLLKSTTINQNPAKFLFLEGDISRVPRSNSKEFKIIKASFVMEGKPLSKTIQKILLNFTDKIWPLLLAKKKEEGTELLEETFNLIKEESLKSNKEIVKFIEPFINDFFRILVDLRTLKFRNNSNLIDRVNGLELKKEKDNLLNIGKSFLEIIKTIDYENLNKIMLDFFENFFEVGVKESNKGDYIKIGKFVEYFPDVFKTVEVDESLEFKKLELKEYLVIFTDILKNLKKEDMEKHFKAYLGAHKKEISDFYNPEEIKFISYVKEQIESFVNNQKFNTEL